MYNPIKKTITGFGLSKSVNTSILLPKKVDDIEQYLKFVKNKNYRIAIKGGGNSYSDVFFNNSLVIDTINLNLIKSFDVDNGVIVVEPGLRIGDLLEKIMPHNWMITGISGSVNDVIGGMLATNVHGKDSWKYGNFNENIVSFKIMFADGSIKNIEKHSDPDLYNSVIGGLGFLGIILEITLQLKKIPSYMVEHNVQRIPNLENLVDFFYSLEKNGIEYAHALINPFSHGKNLGQSIADSSHFVEKENCSHRKFKEFLSKKSKIYLMKPKTFWSLSNIFWCNSTNHINCNLRYTKSKFNSKKIIPFPKYQYPHSAKPNFNFLFTPNGFFEIQSIFNKHNVVDAFSELLSLSKKYKFQPFVCGIKRHKSNSTYLSFANEGLSITMNLSLNSQTKEIRTEYCKKLTDIILKYDGKTYLAKHPYFSKNDFQKMYPNYKKMLELKNKYDPNNLFCSDAIDRLFFN